VGANRSEAWERQGRRPPAEAGRAGKTRWEGPPAASTARLVAGEGAEAAVTAIGEGEMAAEKPRLWRQGPFTYGFAGVAVQAVATVVGPLEGQGPLGPGFDRVWPDNLGQQASFEKAERELLVQSQRLALEKGGYGVEDVDLFMGGDLLDQLITTNFAGRTHGRPLVGLFSACATFTEGLALAAMTVAGGGPRRVLVSVASHHLAAERQFRYPVELGNQRPPTAAWTATAAGSAVVGRGDGPVRVTAATLGAVVDLGQQDPNFMAAAMVPAALWTIRHHLEASGRRPHEYDRILTGDLGAVGRQLLVAYAAQEAGLDLEPVLDDCGLLLYDRARQDVHNGASGAGCAAAVFGAAVFPRLSRDWRRVLLVATGALYSPTSYQQGESIPGIAHAVELEQGG
jgi:stage V sporulation protein AD